MKKRELPRISQQLVNIRRARGLSQARFARLLGFSQSTIAQIERGRKEPSLAALSTMADRLQVDPATLIAGEHTSVWDLSRLKKKVRTPADLSDSEHRSLWELLQFAQKIGYLPSARG